MAMLLSNWRSIPVWSKALALSGVSISITASALFFFISGYWGDLDDSSWEMWVDQQDP